MKINLFNLSIFLNFLISLLMFFISIAYFTIMERKILGLFHIRLGPNKVGILGIFQPFSDVLKLFSKSMNLISKMNKLLTFFSPILLFFLFLILMMFFPIKSELNNLFFNFILINFLFMTFLYGLFFSSYFSFNKFSIISSKRSISQMISYEMGLMMILIFLMFKNQELNMEMLIMILNNNNFLNFILVIFFFIIILSESSRIPFDFIESESELISGFNTEFTSIFFSLFFIYEYGMMLFFSMLISMMMVNFFFSLFLIFLFIHVRSSFPRIRYDKMMEFFWKYFYLLLISLFIVN